LFSTLLCATEAFAADQYQIIPLNSVANPGRPQVHGALIINETNGDNYMCSAFVHQEMPIGFDSIECSKATNKVGSMPPGPAAALSATPDKLVAVEHPRFAERSALPPEADIRQRDCHVRFVPQADIPTSGQGH
jgi:hypothetical protein